MPYYIKRKKKEAIESTKKNIRNKPNLIRKLDTVFSLYIRLRDAMPNGYVRCISCGRIKPFEDVDCGHFFSRTHMATRFDEDNCNAECRFCNRMSADHIISYQKNLVSKIGQQRYDRLNIKAHTTCHWLDSELEEKIRYYKEKVSQLSSLKGIRVKQKS